MGIPNSTNRIFQERENKFNMETHTKNFISFIWDSFCLLEYCKVTLQKKDLNSLESLLLETIQPSDNSINAERKVFEYLLNIRLKTLVRFFEGSFLARQYLTYKLHDYKYLQECFTDKNKILDRLEIIQLAQQIYDRSIISQQIIDRYAMYKGNKLDVFQDTFFRAPSKQTIYLNEYQKNHEQCENDVGTDILRITSAAAGQQDITQNTQDSSQYLQQLSNILNEIKLTSSEFDVIFKILTKNSHKIETITQIPSSWLPMERLFTHLQCIRQLKISSSIIGRCQIDKIIGLIQDNSQLEILFISIDGVLNEKFIHTIRDHPSLRYLSLAITELPADPNSLKQLGCLKEILVKHDQIDQLRRLVQPNQITLKCYSKGLRFSASSFELLKTFKCAFISCGNSFQAFAQAAFIYLTPAQQYAAARTLLEFQSNNIFLDAGIAFTDTEDLRRIQGNVLEMKKDYLYLFMAKLVVELQREILMEEMKILVFSQNIAPFQFIRSQSITADFYF